MRKLRASRNPVVIGLILLLVPAALQAQGTRADYERADRMMREMPLLAYGAVQSPQWIASTDRFWYREHTREGKRFRLVDVSERSLTDAFDHDRLARALSALGGESYEEGDLPFDRITLLPDGSQLQFTHDGARWACNLQTYELTRIGDTAVPGGRGGGRSGTGGRPGSSEENPLPSPDRTQEAFLQDHNVWVRSVSAEEGGEGASRRGTGAEALSFDGGPGSAYTGLRWSPDSSRLLAFVERPGYEHLIQFVESSPNDQLQPKLHERTYTKPGDALPQRRPVIFHVAERRMVRVDDALFGDQYALTRDAWWRDGRGVTLEFNQRGHQLYRVLEVDGSTGEVRVLIEETSPTFIDYSQKRYRQDLGDGEEIIWASERDGWNHLYLIDGRTGRVENQITRGEWVVRSVQHVDEDARQITFFASGREPGDPYLLHLYRIGFDGTGLAELTRGDGNHHVTFSPDRSLFVDTWSKIDTPPVTVVRKASDGSEVMRLPDVDISELEAAGVRTPEPFFAKGRDGTTDIWGVIWRPSGFDPARPWPVLEYIYAGPHSAHVPKDWRAFGGSRALAELGFVVVQIDGMGTNHRGKAFHDVCWRNLGDAGFPDRILWHRAVAERYSWYDIDRGVGIYGTSAGGQSAMGALLFHPEFYTVAVAAAGCHDNRMDKIWWNEQWMGYPIGPWYSESSNVDNAWRLQGHLFLIVGEMDTNVDPASTMQVVDALIEADKDFDLLVIPGADHTSGGRYGERRRRDFFVRYLLGVEPPDWNAEIAVPVGGRY